MIDHPKSKIRAVIPMAPIFGSNDVGAIAWAERSDNLKKAPPATAFCGGVTRVAFNLMGLST
jgi:hypothetical protein